MFGNITVHYMIDGHCVCKLTCQERLIPGEWGTTVLYLRRLRSYGRWTSFFVHPRKRLLFVLFSRGAWKGSTTVTSVFLFSHDTPSHSFRLFSCIISSFSPTIYRITKYTSMWEQDRELCFLLLLSSPFCPSLAGIASGSKSLDCILISWHENSIYDKEASSISRKKSLAFL